MEKSQILKWIQRLIEINKSLKNEQNQDTWMQHVSQLVGYIESIENLELEVKS